MLMSYNIVTVGVL